MASGSVAEVLRLPKKPVKYRKYNLNRNKEGSVRNINGKAYLDFVYLGERVREATGLVYNEKNAKVAREKLDTIIVMIRMGEFRFVKVFPRSRKKGYFAEKEMEAYGLCREPGQVCCKPYFWEWYETLKNSGRVTERTLLGYKHHIEMYLEPYFGDMSFAQLNRSVFEKFISWVRERRYRKKSIGNETINKIFIPFKMICKSATVEYGWTNYNPFYGFRRLAEGDAYEKINPFSLAEQKKLLSQLSEHWKSYFAVAFGLGLRPGEQIAIKLEDIDWKKRILHIRRAMTINLDGKVVEGTTKNKYSRRAIKLFPVMYEALLVQKKIWETLRCNYFFSTESGKSIHRSNLRRRIWLPALKKAGLKVREMKQTRHTFATIALASGENPLWVSNVMGHRNTEMVIKVYSKYVENAVGTNDGNRMNSLLVKGKERQG